MAKGQGAALASSDCHQQAPEQRICHIAVVGERHSGTNLAEQLLARNLDPARVAVKAGLTAHKHWMQPLPASPADFARTLLVVPVRNPYDWAAALHRMCYCCTAMERYGFLDFVQRRYSPDLFTRDAGSGQPCTSDVDTRRGTTFGSVIGMRTAKLRALLDLGQELGMPVEVVRLEDMLRPEGQAAFVQRLVAKYGLPLVGRSADAEGLERQQHWRRRQREGIATAPADAQPLQGTPGQEEELAAGPQAGHQQADKQADPQQSQADSYDAYQAAYQAEEEAQDTADELTDAAGRQADRSSRGGSPVLVGGVLTLGSADARWFVNRRFSAAKRMAESTYLTPNRLVLHWRSLLPEVRAINVQLDWELEQRLGYHALPTPQQAGAIDRQERLRRESRQAAARAVESDGSQGGDIGAGGMVRGAVLSDEAAAAASS